MNVNSLHTLLRKSLMLVCLFGMASVPSMTYANDTIAVDFDQSIESPGDYFGETDSGQVVMLSVATVQTQGGLVLISGALFHGGVQRPVSGFAYSGPWGSTAVFPSWNTMLNAPDTSDSMGSYTLTGTNSRTGASVNDKLEITETANGKVTKFKVNFRTYTWNEELRIYEHYPSLGSYVFYSNGDGTYDYKKLGHGIGTFTLETGTAVLDMP